MTKNTKRSSNLIIICIGLTLLSMITKKDIPSGIIKVVYCVKEKNLFAKNSMAYYTKSYLLKRNDSILFAKCSKDYSTTDNCLYGIPFIYQKLNNSISCLFNLEKTSYDYKRYSLIKGDTIYSISELKEISSLSSDYTIYQGEQTLTINKKKYPCFVFRSCKFKTFNQKEVFRIFIYKYELIPLKMSIELFTVNSRKLGVSYEAVATKVN